MNQRTRIVAGILIGLVLIIAVWGLIGPREPEYQNRPISAWLDDWAANRGHGSWEAVSKIGTNCLPYAIRNLERNDSKWRSSYEKWRLKAPNWLGKMLPAPKPVLQVVDVANVFSYLGTNSIPQAIALLKHQSPTVRQAAAWGLSSLRRQSAHANQAIPALVEALDDPDPQVRFNAALAFKEMGLDASNAVPALTRVVANRGVGSLTNSNFYLRAVAASALGKIGPSAASAIPTLRSALTESNAYLRGQAAVAIWRIRSDSETTLPVLMEAMLGESEHSKWDWIIALGEMGPRAKAALPQLQKELQEDKQAWVLQYVTNAINQISVEDVPMKPTQ